MSYGYYKYLFQMVCLKSNQPLEIAITQWKEKYKKISFKGFLLIQKKTSK